MLPYFPALHLVQLVSPSVIEYVPAEHGKQFVEELEATLVEYFPEAHSKQLSAFVAPTVAEYFPPGHDMQALDLAPIWSENLPAGHAIHIDSDLDAYRSLYLPSGHKMQSAVPIMDLYLP